MKIHQCDGQDRKPIALEDVLKHEADLLKIEVGLVQITLAHRALHTVHHVSHLLQIAHQLPLTPQAKGR